ncbi:MULTISPECIES: hypothetical protein [Kordiimonas]|nr:hypothetical protein [Kordiimonas aestuarii]
MTYKDLFKKKTDATQKPPVVKAAVVDAKAKEAPAKSTTAAPK